MITCPNCFKELTELHYQEQKNNTKHLVGKCSDHGLKYLPFVPDLPIKTIPSKALLKKQIQMSFKSGD